MFEDILPQSVPYRIIQSSVISAESFQCEIKLKINSEDAIFDWMKEFENKTNSSWILRRSTAAENSSFRLSRNYVCQHSAYRKKEGGSKNKNCLASLTIRLKNDSKHVRFKDPFAKDGFFCTIKINFMHSHKINVAEAWNWLPRDEKTKQTFIDLFNCGMSPAAAKNYHESLLLTESPEQLANSRINPPARWIYSIYEKWQEENYGGLKSGPNFKRVLENKVKEYAEVGNILEFQDNPFSLIILTPLMQRMVISLEESVSVFIDSTASCDQAKSTITIVLVATKAGAIPIGVGVHKCQSEENYNILFSMFKQAWSEIKPFSILNFMTDDSAALKGALCNVFPSVKQLLCQFHVPQAFWQWLWNAKHNIADEDKKTIMLLFRAIVYAGTVHDFNRSVEIFFNSSIAKKYDKLLDHVSNFLKRKEEWCLLFRLDIKNLSHNTNNYSEATMRVFKEIILTRLKAFNLIALMEFVVNVFDKYLCKRLLDVVFGRLKKNHIVFQKFLDKGSKVLDECIVAKEEDFFVVESQKDNQTYIVNDGVCSCPIGMQGAFCKHQAAIHLKFNVMFPNAPVLLEFEKEKYYEIAVSAKNVDLNFLEPMMPETMSESESMVVCQSKLVDDIIHSTNNFNNDPLCPQDIARDFRKKMEEIAAAIENCNNQGVLSNVKKYVNQTEVKTVSQLQIYIDGCLSNNLNRTSRRGKK